MRKIAIGDIHGCYKTFKALLNQVQLTKDDELTLMGDYIDRGSESKRVIDTIIELQLKGFNVRPLRGNHEQMLLDTIKPESDIMAFDRWLNMAGGKFTMESFGNQLEEYLPFFQELPFVLLDDDYVFVHAGLNFKIENPLSDFYSMLWERNFYKNIRKSWLQGRIIVHGHTPIPFSRIQSQFNRLVKKSWFTIPALNIDSGCVFGKGGMVAVDFANKKLYTQDNIDGIFTDSNIF